MARYVRAVKHSAEWDWAYKEGMAEELLKKAKEAATSRQGVVAWLGAHVGGFSCGANKRIHDAWCQLGSGSV